MKRVIVYVAGPVAALKTNQWSMMTNDRAAAEAAVRDNEGWTQKAIEVKPPRGKGGKNAKGS